METSFIFLANGFEEIEALSVVDILRRAGMPIATISINDTPLVVGAHGIQVYADAVYTDAPEVLIDSDWLICPGGMPGSKKLSEYEPLCELLKAHAADGGNIAAICAAPAVVLAPLGILDKKDATCYPGFEAQCKACGAKMHDGPVVVDGNIVTGNGPAAAMPFALEIVKQTLGDDAAQQIGSGMLYY